MIIWLIFTVNTSFRSAGDLRFHNYPGSEAEFTYIQEKTGKLPAIRGFDFMNYRGNGLMWDDQCAERVIEWYKEKGGIPTVCWHWFSPGDIGKKADNSFYTESTTFSISRALTPGTEENIALLNDIDTMPESSSRFRMPEFRYCQTAP